MKNIIEENEKITVNTKEIEILKKHFPNCFNKDTNLLLFISRTIVQNSLLNFIENTLPWNVSVTIYDAFLKYASTSKGEGMTTSSHQEK